MDWRIDPFPHAVLKDYWPDELLEGVLDELEKAREGNLPGWVKFNNAHERKWGNDNMAAWGPHTMNLYRQMVEGLFFEELVQVTGLEDLTPDATGGGYHSVPAHGYLDVHYDFNRKGPLYRRVNVLVYLNRDWAAKSLTELAGGHLQLWNQDRDGFVDVPPEFNTTVVFETSDRSWHGHPMPHLGRWRNSFALYYYSHEPPDGYTDDHSTMWMVD